MKFRELVDCGNHFKVIFHVLDKSSGSWVEESDDASAYVGSVLHDLALVISSGGASENRCEFDFMVTSFRETR